jgi:hypothetical protein
MVLGMYFFFVSFITLIKTFQMTHHSHVYDFLFRLCEMNTKQWWLHPYTKVEYSRFLTQLFFFAWIASMDELSCLGSVPACN